MAGEQDEPSLELPSFRMPRLPRRRRGARSTGDEPVPEQPVVDRPVQPQPAPGRPGADRPAEDDLENHLEPVARRPRTAPAPGIVTRRLSATEPPATAGQDQPPERAQQERPSRPAPAPAPLPAALAVGVVVGLVGVGLAWLAARGCDAVLGTPSCGGGPGLLFWVAIVLILAWVGRTLLALLAAPDPGGTSALAVGLLAVLTLLLLVDRLDSWTGAVAAPVLAAVSFALARLVATAVGDAD